MRERQLNIRLSEEESGRFERVADHYGLNIAATIRMLFKEKARELGFEAPPNLAEATAARARAYYSTPTTPKKKPAK